MNRIRERQWAALAVFAAVGIAACQPGPYPAPDDGLGDERIDAIILGTTWVGCSTVARDAEGGRYTDVEICAAEDAISYGTDNAPTLTKPIAKMTNRGDFVEKRWGLRPKQSYVIRLRREISTGIAAYSIEGRGIPDQRGTYYACPHAKYDTTSRATFGACSDALPSGEMPRPPRAPGSRGPAVVQESGVGGHVLLSQGSGPAWITCREGCCTTGAS